MTLRDPDVLDLQLRENLEGLDLNLKSASAATRKVANRVTVLEGRGTSGRAERAAASSTNLTTSYVTYFSVTVTTTGRPLLVNYYFVYSNQDSGAYRTIDVRTQLDGGTVGQTRTLGASLVAGQAHKLTASGSHLLTSLAAGEHTFVVQALASNAASVAIREGELTVLET